MANNMHVSLLNSFIKNLNLTECWICISLPKTVDQGFQLIGIPIPKAVNWNRYWYNTTFTDTYKEQIWDIQLPKQGNYSIVFKDVILLRVLIDSYAEITHLWEIGQTAKPQPQ